MEYIAETEVISYILSSRGRGIATGDKSNGKNSSQGKPTYLFTDRRVLSILPQEDGDEVTEIRYSNITDIENNFGFTKYRMAIQTDSEEYHLWLSNSHSKSEIIEASRLASEGEVTKIQDQLGPNEEVAYEFSADKRGIHIHTDGDITKIDKTEADMKSKFLFTDRRFLASIPKQGEDDQRFSVDYSSITDVSLTTGRTKKRIDIFTDGRRYKFWIKNYESTQDLLNFVYNNISRRRFALIWDGDGKGELEILDRSTGIARMETEGQTKGKSKGWNYGIDFLERTSQSHNLESTSTSVIEEEGYTATIHECVVSGRQVYLKTDDPDGQRNAKQEIRRLFDEIGAVDSHENGFTLFTTTGIYRLSFSDIPDEEIEKAAQYVRESVHNEPQKADEQPAARSSNDNLEKLEKLAELEEQGIISEGEFEEKKQQLLDDI